MSIPQYVKIIDRFPHQLSIKANKKQTHSTFLTVLASFLLIGFFCLYFPMKMWNYLKDRPFNLNVTFSRLNRKDPKILQPESMRIMSVLNEALPKSDETGSNQGKNYLNTENKDMFMARKTYTSDIKGPKIEQQSVGEVLPCTDDKTNGEYDYFFNSSENLKKQRQGSVCSIANQNVNIGGEYFLNGSYSTFQMHIPYILTFEEGEGGEDKLGSCPAMESDAFFGFVYQTNVPNYNLEVPYEKTTVSNSWFIHDFKYFEVKLILRKTIVTTDENYLGDFFSTKKTEFYSLKEVKLHRAHEVDPYSAEDKSHCEVDVIYAIEVDDEVLEVTREYEKLDNFVANTTGLIGFLALFFKFSLEYIEDSVFDEELVRNLYYRSNFLKVNLNKEHDAISDKPSVDRLKTIVDSTKRVSTISKDTKKSFFCCTKKRKNTVSQKAMKYFEYDSDVLSLVRKSLLLESLVKVLLTDDQVDLMNLINVRPVDKNEDVEEEIRKIEERFPMASQMSSLSSKIERNKANIAGDDYITNRIMEEIEKNDV